MAGSWGEMLVGIKEGGRTQGGQVANAPVTCPGGNMVFAAAGNFGTATAVAVQMLGPDGATFIATPTSSSLTAAGATANFFLPPGTIQAVITGGPATALFASIARVVT